MNNVKNELDKLINEDLKNFILPNDCGLNYLGISYIWDKLSDYERKLLYYMDDINLVKGSFKYANKDREFYNKMLESYANMGLYYGFDNMHVLFKNLNVLI